jgi:hypothetical protein
VDRRIASHIGFNVRQAGETLLAACDYHPAQLHRETAATGPRAEPPAERNQRPRAAHGEGPRGGRRALPLSLALSEKLLGLRASAGAWRSGATRSGRGLDRSSGRLFAAAVAFAENGMPLVMRTARFRIE